MDNSLYSRRIEEDSAVSFGRESNYSKLDNMDGMDMDAKLIQSSKQSFLARNWKWIYAGVGILAGCILTAGICYMFFSLGKGKGHGNTQSNVGSLNGGQNQINQWLKSSNGSISQEDFSYLSRLLRTEAVKFKGDMAALLTEYMKMLYTKQDSEKILTILQDIRNDSQQELQIANESKDQIAKLIEMIEIIKKNGSTSGSPEVKNMKDCVDWKREGFTTDGVYTITPAVATKIEVYCDMTTDDGGWLVFQRRVNGSTNFFRVWKEYEDGFGDLEDEFWLGNKNLHILTSTYPTELRVDVQDWDGKRRFAKYSTFKIGDAASKYTLYAEGYSGNAGDGLALHHEVKFSTLDQDNDIRRKDCAGTTKSAWWFENCSHSSLNGEYIRGGRAGKNKGINWEKFKGDYYSMKTASMMLRRTS